MNGAHRGFTLIEMTIVLVVLTVASALVVPALVDFGTSKQRRTADALLSLLNASRAVAIDSNVTVTLIIDPVTGKYRVDSMGIGGAGPVAAGKLDLAGMESMVTTLDRLNYTFRPTGAALGDTVRVRGSDSSLVVQVDPWSGVARASAQ